jgi:hypothetical protein
MANRSYRLGQRHAARAPYDPGHYRVNWRRDRQPDTVTASALTRQKPRLTATEQESADLAAVRAGTATPAQKSRVYQRPLTPAGAS